ncbi:MAG: MmcQ/YjbR family DNA-binding protein [Gemmataceae bacterium]|nr:MmcQ/YjbR family DNA-binding protein [Gemmataceae bacterium]
MAGSNASCQYLQDLALCYPATGQGITCGKTSFKAGGKSFLFMESGADGFEVMLKLGPSLQEAAQLEKKEPAHYVVGGHNWVRLRFTHRDKLPRQLVKKWLEESFRLLAPIKNVALLKKGEAPASLG